MKKIMNLRLFACFIVYFLLFTFVPVNNANNSLVENNHNDDWWSHWIGDKNRNGVDDLIDEKNQKWK